jgi:hypothetical protein
MLALTIASLALHFVPVVTNLLKRGGGSPAPSDGTPTTPVSPSPVTNRPVLDFIHSLMVQAEGSGNPAIAGGAQILDSDLSLLRQVLDNMGVKPLITIKP